MLQYDDSGLLYFLTHIGDTLEESTGKTTVIDTPQLDQVIQKMDNFITQFSEQDDPRERFLVMYRTFKKQLRRNLQEGRFLDSEWSEAICCRMGEMYFEAYDQYESETDVCPQAWKLCFDASINHETNLLQDALLGMNAHINYDLTICTYDIMDRFHDLGQGTDNPVDRTLNQLLRKRYFDYLLINQIAWESIPKIQDVLTERFSKLLGVLNVLSFRFSRPIVQKIIMDHRDRAWTHALLMASSRDPVEVERVKSFIDTLAIRNVHLVRKKLSFNPIDLMQETLQPTPIDFIPADEYLDPQVGKLLIDRLKDRHTTEYANRALVQFGKNALPLLRETLQREPDSEELTQKIIGILGEIGSVEAANILLENTSCSIEKCRSSVLDILADLISDGMNLPVDNDNLHALMQNEVNHFYNLEVIVNDLTDLPKNEFILESLAARKTRVLGRILNLLTVLTSDSRYNLSPRELQNLDHSVFGTISRISLAREIDQNLYKLLHPILDNDPTEIERIAHHYLQIESLPAMERLQTFAQNHSDQWLQQCAVYYLANRAKDSESTADLPNELKNREDDMKSTIEKILHLKNVDLFYEIPAEDLTGVAKIAYEKHFKDGEYLIKQGTIGKHLIVILNGKVRVVKESGTMLAQLGANDVLGEMSLLSESKTSANCIAAGPVEVLEIGRQEFRNLLYGDYPEISLGLLKVLSERLQKTDQKVS